MTTTTAMKDSIKAGELRKYQYRGKNGRISKAAMKRSLKLIAATYKAVKTLTELSIAMQKARQAAKGLPEYAAGGVSMDSLASVGDSGSEIIANPVK